MARRIGQEVVIITKTFILIDISVSHVRGFEIKTKRINSKIDRPVATIRAHFRRQRLLPLTLSIVWVFLAIGLAAYSVEPALAAPALNCFSSPGACNYPDPASHNVGVTDCSSLPTFSFSSIPSGTYYSGSGNLLEIVSNNVTLSNYNMGDVNIYVSDVDNFTLDNVCVNANGGANEGSNAIGISANSHNTTIENSNISGINDTTEALGTGILNYGPDTTIQSDYIYNVGTGVSTNSPATLKDNYMLVNAVPAGEHDEDIYLSDTTATVDHNVLLNEEDQTAALFGNTNGGSGGACSNQLTITNNLLAGGDYVLYPCGNASSVGTSTSDIENNAFARCDGGTNVSAPGDAGACPSGADSHGYYPFGGTYGLTAYYFSGADQAWCGNHWDDSGTYIGPDGGTGASCSPDPGGGGTGTGGSTSNSNGTGRSATGKAPDTGYGTASAYNFKPLILALLAITSISLGAYIMPKKPLYRAIIYRGDS